MNLWIWASVIFSSSASETRPLATALALIFSVLSPAAVVGDADDDVAASDSGSRMVPCSGLPQARARPGSPGRDRRNCAPCG